MYEITQQDIEGYLASKSDDEVIGFCLNSTACLAHNTLTWKYGLEDSDVTALCSHAFVDGIGVLEFPRTVESIVRTFDTLKTPGAPVTKAEFMGAL